MTRPKRPCSVEGCNRPHKSHGYCKPHSARFKRYGDPMAGPTERGRAAAFLDQAVSYAGDQCLLWPFATNGTGYGIAQDRGAMRYVHRIVCERAHGAPPSKGHEVAHDNNGIPCVSRACVNPKHLRWATRSDNCLDKNAHDTSQRGERNPFAKLTTEQVQEIRSLKGRASQREIAEMFGVARETVRNVHIGSTWQHDG